MNPAAAGLTKIPVDRRMIPKPTMGPMTSARRDVRESGRGAGCASCVGESTGALDSMLGKIADFYEDEVDQAVTNLTALLEPMMMVFLGVTVGFIVVAMYLPIFTMASAIG